MTSIEEPPRQPEFWERVLWGRVICGTILAIIISWLFIPYSHYTENGWVIYVIVALAVALAISGLPFRKSAGGVYSASVSQPMSQEAARHWFWAIIFLSVLAVAGANAMEDDLVAGVVSVGFIALGAGMLHYIAGVNVVQRVWKSGWRVPMYVMLYLVIGILFSLFRWDYHVYDWRQDYDQAKVQYEQSVQSGIETAPWKESYEHRYRIQNTPTFAQSKARITRWVVFWPWSASYFFLSDLVVRGLDWLISKFSGVYDWLSERYTKDLA